MQILNFPSTQNLWQGAIRRTIFHSLWIASNPTLAYEVSWDQINYLRQNSMGTRGVVTFDKNQIVGVFFDEHSQRNPFKRLQKDTSDVFIQQLPSKLAELARKEACQYVLEEIDGNLMPAITAIFWGTKSQITALEPWEVVLKNGAHIISVESLDNQAAIIMLQKEYNLSSEQIMLANSLYNRHITNPTQSISFNVEERKILLGKGNAGLDECRDLLSTINIIV